MHVGVHVCVCVYLPELSSPVSLSSSYWTDFWVSRTTGNHSGNCPYWAPPFEGRGSFITGHSWNVSTVSPPGSWAS